MDLPNTRGDRRWAHLELLLSAGSDVYYDFVLRSRFAISPALKRQGQDPVTERLFFGKTAAV